MKNNKSKVLVIYTGGTIGMVLDADTGQYKPFDFDHFLELVPELNLLDVELGMFTFGNPIDSSDITPNEWIKIATTIEKEYNDYDGFVVLHGSDTMSYTASMLSFMLEGLNKPVILTGSQLPIGVVRTDGKENLITSIEIAAAKDKNGNAVVPEVGLYFEYQLLRGNRSYKHNAGHFDAFRSDNYPQLAEAGVHIFYNTAAIHPFGNTTLKVQQTLCDNIGILKFFPGINPHFVENILNVKGQKAIVLETFGSGNTTTAPWFLKTLKKATDNGLVIINVTQCREGTVEQGRYETSGKFNSIGIISGYDITTESAVTKLMYLFGKTDNSEEVKRLFPIPIAGEMSIG